MKVYKGKRTPSGKTEVTVDDRPLNPRTDIHEHTPMGFDWGFGGNGSMQLALAIIYDLLGDSSEARIYGDYGLEITSCIVADTWSITESEVWDWLAQHGIHPPAKQEKPIERQEPARQKKPAKQKHQNNTTGSTVQGTKSQNILLTCKKLGLSHKELADAIGVPEQAVQEWSSSGLLPLWAKSSMALLVENSMLKHKLNIFTEAYKMVNEL